MELKQALEEELKSCKFIQLGSLHRLITPNSVASHLGKNCPNNEVLQQIASSAPKLFAILILLQQETAITKYLSKGFCDKDFPILDKAQIPDLKYGEIKQGLYEKQWCIPIVLDQSQHLDLPLEFKAPLFFQNDHKRHGTFGMVSRVRVADGHLPHHSSSDSFALKQIRKNDRSEWDSMMREVETLRTRRHQYIVPLLASWNDRSMESEDCVVHLNLLFPYSISNLEDWMIKPKAPSDWQNETDSKKLKEYVYDSIMSLCDAVAYLHKEIGGLITSHHDLKPENILLFGRTWKIADFGRTHLIRLSAGSDTEGASGLGTFTYQPPEYWTPQGSPADTRHGRAFDVWALGCIAVELLTLAVYGWSDEKQNKQNEFREKRRNNQRRRSLFHGQRAKSDISFHNNMNVVKEWMCQLRKRDDSSNLTAMLEIADRMLNTDPHTRPLSWEIYLDFNELLDRNNTTSEKEQQTKDRVQKPNRHHEIHEDNPLQRAAATRNILRVKYLLQAGWSHYPVNTSQLDGEDGLEILKMIKVAKSIKGIQFRRENKFEKARSMKSSAKSVSPQTPPATKNQQDLQQDVQGMTELHHLCKANKIWHVKSFLDRRTSDFVARILTCEDHKGRLPLHYAAETGSKDLVDFLLDSFKLDPTVLVATQDSMKRTPLHIAADNDHDKLIKLLVFAHKGSAEYLQMRDQNSMTALDLARRRGTKGTKTTLELERAIRVGK